MPPLSPVCREVSSPTLAPPPTGSYGEKVSIEKLQAELWKQKQLTEVLRYEVGQQEGEKRKVSVGRVPEIEYGYGASVVKNDLSASIYEKTVILNDT